MRGSEPAEDTFLPPDLRAVTAGWGLARGSAEHLVREGIALPVGGAVDQVAVGGQRCRRPRRGVREQAAQVVRLGHARAHVGHASVRTPAEPAQDGGEEGRVVKDLVRHLLPRHPGGDDEGWHPDPVAAEGRVIVRGGRRRDVVVKPPVLVEGDHQQCARPRRAVDAAV